MDLDISKLNLQIEELSEVKWVNKTELEKILSGDSTGYVMHKEEFKVLLDLMNLRTDPSV